MAWPMVRLSATRRTHVVMTNAHEPKRYSVLCV